MVKCGEKEPKEWPTFSDLVRGFEQLLLKEMDYIDLNLFSENDYYNEYLSGEPESVWKNTKTKQEFHTKIHAMAIFESLFRKKLGYGQLIKESQFTKFVTKNCFQFIKLVQFVVMNRQ